MNGPSEVIDNGAELHIFAHARNWKNYFVSQLAPFVHGQVIEVGAGLGAVAQVATARTQFTEWACLEPDGRLLEAVEAKILAGRLDPRCRPRQATLEEYLDGRTAVCDTVMYIDVLEHIRDDAAELATASRALRPGGSLIVMAPAHQSLFSPFDAAIGHYRRYSRPGLEAVAPGDLRVVLSRYLDTVGIALMLAQRALLRQSMPAYRQIWVWDRLCIPISRVVDSLLGYRWGKSVLTIWRKAG